MRVSFKRYIADDGISAFASDHKMVMSFGSPIVSRYFTAEEIQEYICTLEQAIDDEPNMGQKLGLKRILNSFIVSLDLLKENHEAFIQEAPTGADLEEYMLSYARAIKGGTL
jgi:hypothetical protein